MYTSKITPFPHHLHLAIATPHGDELEYVKSAIDTNWITCAGENVTAVEQAIPAYLAEHASVPAPVSAVALGTGTSALHLCMKLAGVKPGDIVLCSSMTFAATVNPVSYEGGRQVFIDSEEETWNMSPEALELAFRQYPEAKVVVAANLYGTPGKLDELAAICEKHGAVLIEDAAESLGATYKGRQTGTFGKYNAISFNGNKIITGSCGGMLLTADAESAALARKWSTQSREPAPWYQHQDLGYNYRMSNITAGILRAQINHLDEHIEQKKAVYYRYKEGLKGLPVKMNPVEDTGRGEGTAPNYWLSCLTIDKEYMCPQHRTDLTVSYERQHGKTCPSEILETLAAHDAEGRPIWKPMHMQPVFSTCGFVSQRPEKPVNEDIFERGLCLPSDNSMLPEDQERVIEIIRRCFD